MFRKLAGLTAIAGLFIAGTASAAITDSAHDFRAVGAATWDVSGQTRICNVCHTPHDALTDAISAAAPLWNHTPTGETSNYQEYSNTTLENQPVDGLNPQSKLCLSCHDGTIAIDSFGGAPSTGGPTLIATDAAYVGTDLRNDHPVSITYVDATATSDGSLATPSTKNVTLATGGTGLLQDKMLYGGFVECASCHDVHDTAGTTNLLKIDNAGSALCLTCHEK